MRCRRSPSFNTCNSPPAPGDFAAADKALNQYKTSLGTTPEYLDAFSRVGRARLAAHSFAAADANALETLKLSEAQLAHRKLDLEPELPLALGAAIEVHAQALAGENRRDEAVVFLHDQLTKWQATSIRDRIQKNVNLLTLEGKPAPVLDVSQGIGPRKPLPLAAHLGHPVLIFLWAHWCPDCKEEVRIVRRLMDTYGPRGLVVIAPTQHYGYVAQGDPAPPAVETKYISAVFTKYYAELGSVEIPLSEANFTRFGVSTTPTMVQWWTGRESSASTIPAPPTTRSLRREDRAIARAGPQFIVKALNNSLNVA